MTNDWTSRTCLTPSHQICIISNRFRYFLSPGVVRATDFSTLFLENEFSFMYDMPDFSVSRALLCLVDKYF